jgi:hypothetical protein
VRGGTHFATEIVLATPRASPLSLNCVSALPVIGTLIAPMTSTSVQVSTSSNSVKPRSDMMTLVS